MSAGLIVALVVALAAVGVGVAFAVGAFEEVPPSTTVAAALAGTTMTASAPSRTAPTSEPVSTTAGDDPLCSSYDEFQTTTDGHLPVEDPDDLEIVSTATLAFYTEAVEWVDPSVQGALAELCSTPKLNTTTPRPSGGTRHLLWKSSWTARRRLRLPQPPRP